MFGIRMTCPRLAKALISIFICILSISNCLRISYMFIFSFSNLSKVFLLLSFQINRYARSATVCIFWQSVFVHALAIASKSIVDSTTAYTMAACVLFEKLDFHYQIFTLTHAAYPRLILAAWSRSLTLSYINSDVLGSFISKG